MTIKEATQQMLWNIERRNTRECNEKGVRSYDKQIAKQLELTPASYSRLRTGVTNPKITTWYKIVKLHEKKVGVGITQTIINQIK